MLQELWWRSLVLHVTLNGIGNMDVYNFPTGLKNRLLGVLSTFFFEDFLAGGALAAASSTARVE